MSGIISCRKKSIKVLIFLYYHFIFGVRRQSRSRRYIYLVGRILNYSCKVSRQCFSRFEYVFFYSHEGPCIFLVVLNMYFLFTWRTMHFFLYIWTGYLPNPPFLFFFFFKFLFLFYRVYFYWFVYFPLPFRITKNTKLQWFQFDSLTIE